MNRTKKTLLNVRVNLLFSVVMIFITFFSRKIFLHSLGNELVGLITIIFNILGFLNLTELGISTAASFLLYKPLLNENRLEIEDIVSVFGFYYKRIGFVIITLGIIISCFLPLIFKSTPIPIFTIYATFFTFLLSSLFGYFFNYKQFLLIADQKNYLVLTYISTITICKIILQIVTVLYTKGGYYGYLLLEIISISFTSLIINVKIKKEYPWLNSNAKNGKLIRKNYLGIIKISKKLFSHQFAGFILTQTDSLLIFSFTSLTVVTVFSNYMLIIQKLFSLTNDALNNTSAAVGNIIATKDMHNIKKVFGELTALRYWTAGIIVFCLYQLIPPFILIWIGPKYILNEKVFYLMLVNIYIMLTRQTVLSFLSGYGLFQDIWAPWTEAILNIGLSILLGFYFGIIGVVIGTTVSLFLIVVLWKPYFLFKESFISSIKEYWSMTLLYLVQFVVCGYLFSKILYLIIDTHRKINIYELIIKGLFYTFFFGMIYGFIMYCTTQSMRNLTNRLITLTGLKNIRNI